MSKQVVYPHEQVDIAGCPRCRSYENTGIFALCKHDSSKYQVGDKAEFHTCEHMRCSDGLCGPEKRLAR